MKIKYLAKSITGLILWMVMFTPLLSAQGVLTFEDVMKFEDIRSPQFSSNGNWIAYDVWPDRGDGKVVIQHTSNSTEYELDLGSSARITSNEKWVFAYKNVPLVEQIKAKKDQPKRGLMYLNLSSGNTSEVDRVASYSLSNDGKWVAIKHYATKEIEELKHKNKKLGTPVKLINLESGSETKLPFVSSMSFDSLSTHFAYATVDTSGEQNGLFVYNLKNENSMSVDASENTFYSNITWDNKRARMAYTKAPFNEDYEVSDAELKLWEANNSSAKSLVLSTDVDPDYALTSVNSLRFTHDGKRLFFGLQGRAMADVGKKESDDSEVDIDIYSVEDIVDNREMDLWHGDDPRIKTHEIVTWNSRKNHLYTSVYHLDQNNWVQLADVRMPEIRIDHSSKTVLGYNGDPYLIEVTWDGSYNDWYIVDLNNGKRTRFVEKLGGFTYQSPNDAYVVYYDDSNWHVYDTQSKETKSLTASIDTPFYNEDHDYPSDVPGYGVAGWVDKGNSVLINDKYDVWHFNLSSGKATNITNGEGRTEKRIFRVTNLEDKDYFKNGEEILLTAYHDLKKNFGFYSTKINGSGVKQILEEDKKFTLVAKAEDSNKILYKREAYDEFPNLWVANDKSFKRTKQVSQLHMDLKQKWNWGTAELVDWLSLDGTYMQGIIIKPDNYDPKKRYPIMTYYYRFYSNRLHDFNEPKTNHRPVFAQYVSDDYVVFLPDIRFEIGRPGFAATKSLVPGVQKLIEMGIADEDKLGLHGHSWSGYQTAFIVTQTDIFDAAVSGAPVSNMTSAYAGIRWASGLARQFQYEKTQSRIGQSLVEAPEKYIENSPVFFADKITTPMLIQHGDADGAVPWYQSIEMYLAMRRYNKDVIFLQYHGEPHHLQKFPNKLDYAIRMKEYFDYYLKGEGSPEWILKGEAYQGK